MFQIAADKARDRSTGEVVALKKLRMDRERDGAQTFFCSGYLCVRHKLALLIHTLLCVRRDACNISARAAGATELQAPKLGRAQKGGDWQEA